MIQETSATDPVGQRIDVLITLRLKQCYFRKTGRYNSDETVKIILRETSGP